MTVRGHRRPHVVPISAPSFPTLPRPRLFRNIAYTFVGLVVLIVVGVLWLSSVRAEIFIKTQQHAVRWDGAVEVAKTAGAGQIPGRVVQSVFEKIQEFKVAAVTSTEPASVAVPAVQPTVSVSAPDETLLAKGSVRIINKYSKAQTLVKTTRLLTSDNKLYRIDRTINVPSGGEVVVEVYADEAGSLYAIGPTKFTIPGLFVDLQKYIYAVSDAAFIATPSSVVSTKTKTVAKPATKITADTGKTVTQQNIDQAQKELTEIVLDQAKKALSAEVADARLTETVYFVKVLEKKANVIAGQSADTFLASIKLDVTVVYYPKDDMTTYVRTKLKEKIPEGRELLPLDNASAVYVLESTDTKDEKASIHVTIDASYRLTANSPALDKGFVAGKSKDEATRLLKTIDGVDEVTIKLSPSWFSKIPTLKDHIEIKVE